MLISRSLTLAVLGLGLGSGLLAAGCDRQSAAPAQPEANNTTAKADESAKTLPETLGETLGGTIDRSHKGSRIPDFTLADPQGRKLRLVDLVGKPVLLNLWATWCAPCVAEMPTLDALAGAQQGKLAVVAASQDMRSEAVAPFFAQRGLRNLEPWLDPDTNLAFHFGGVPLPTTILYDAQGHEIWRIAGGYDWSGKAAAALLAEAER